MDSLKVDWQVTVPPTVEPVSLSDLRSTTIGSYLRVDFTDDDTILSALISQCREDAEIKTGKSFAPQTLQVMFTMPQLSMEFLSGAKLMYGQDFFQYNESLGANPFSPAPFVLPMPQPPLVAVSAFEYRITAFAAWQTWPLLQSDGITPNYAVDTLPLPGVVYLQYPPPAYQYRLTYTAGYSTLPAGLKLALIQMIAWKYENRLADTLPDEILSTLMGRKIWVL
jgi:hypothetical protein